MQSGRRGEGGGGAGDLDGVRKERVGGETET